MAAGKKRSSRIFIIIILIIAVGAVLAYLLLTGNSGLTGLSPAQNQPDATATPNLEMVDIVIASQSIARGNIITADVLTTIKYPLLQMPQGMFFTKIEDVVGLKAKINIDPTVPLTVNMVMEENSGSLASFDIPAGMVAKSIAVSPETNVAFAPQNGDHVMVNGCMLLTELDTDFQTRLPNNLNTTYAPPGVITDRGSVLSVAMDPSTEGQLQYYGRYELDPSTNQFIYLSASESQRPRLVCQTIIQDAMILNVGMFDAESAATGLAPTPTPVVEATPGASVNNMPTTYAGSVTLVVSPQDNLILNYMELSGSKLSLALRSAGDGSVITTDPVTLQYIMEQKNIPSPIKLPYSVEPRVDTLIYPGYNDYILIQP